MGQAKQRGNFIERLKEANMKKEINERVKDIREKTLSQHASKLAYQLLEDNSKIYFSFSGGKIYNIESENIIVGKDDVLKLLQYQEKINILLEISEILEKEGVKTPRMNTYGQYCGRVTALVDDSKDDTAKTNDADPTKIVVIDESTEFDQTQFNIIRNSGKTVATKAVLNG